MLPQRDGSRALEVRIVELRNIRPSHGRLFEPVEEQDLYPALRSLASRLPGASRGGVVLIPELAGPYGVADLIAVVGAAVRLEERLKAGVPPLLSERDCALVAAAGLRGAKRDDLPALANQAPPEAQKRISRLVSVGALEVSTYNTVRRLRAIEPVGRVWALEAKLGSWSRALTQALRYGLWADGSAAVINHIAERRRSLAIERAKSLGVGLAVQDRWLVRPALHSHSPARRLLCSEHIIAAVSDSQQ